MFFKLKTQVSIARQLGKQAKLPETYTDYANQNLKRWSVSLFKLGFVYQNAPLEFHKGTP